MNEINNVQQFWLISYISLIPSSYKSMHFAGIDDIAARRELMKKPVSL